MHKITKLTISLYSKDIVEKNLVNIYVTLKCHESYCSNIKVDSFVKFETKLKILLDITKILLKYDLLS